MTPAEVITFLRRYNEWRRTDDRYGLPYPDPREIGEAIDAAIEMIERIPSRIAPEQAPGYVRNYSHKAAEGYADGWNACMKAMRGEGK